VLPRGVSVQARGHVQFPLRPPLRSLHMVSRWYRRQRICQGRLLQSEAVWHVRPGLLWQHDSTPVRTRGVRRLQHVAIQSIPESLLRVRWPRVQSREFGIQIRFRCESSLRDRIRIYSYRSVFFENVPERPGDCPRAHSRACSQSEVLRGLLRQSVLVFVQNVLQYPDVLHQIYGQRGWDY